MLRAMTIDVLALTLAVPSLPCTRIQASCAPAATSGKILENPHPLAQIRPL